jgi:hypothetical protein
MVSHHQARLSFTKKIHGLEGNVAITLGPSEISLDEKSGV